MSPDEVERTVQFLLHHQAQFAVAQSGRLGLITQAQVSAAHGYHGISVIRRFLGVTRITPFIRF